MSLPDPDELVQLKSQRTIGTDDGNNVEKWTLIVWSISSPHARRRARQWTRRNVPTAKNILSPDVEGTEQSTLQQFFNEGFDAEFREVELVVVRSF